MGSVYGKPVSQKPVSKPPTAFDAIQTLYKQVETINLSVKQKTNLAQTYYAKAKEHVANGKKEDAKLFLERKALLDKRVAQLLKTVTMLEAQIAALESASMNNDILRVTEATNTAIKNTEMSPDKASDTMDEVREAMQNAADISSILSEPVVDVPDVSDELDSMMQSNAQVSLPEPPTTVHSAPVKTEIEEELRKLEVAC